MDQKIINLLQNSWSHRDALIEELREADAEAYQHPGCEYRVYIDSEGVTSNEIWPAGDNGHFRFPGGYYRVYIGTLCHQHYSLLDDYWYEGTGLRAADCTDEENEAAMQEALDEVLWSPEAVQQYHAMIDQAIDDIKYWGRDE